MFQACPVRPKCHRPRVHINKIINLELTQNFWVPEQAKLPVGHRFSESAFWVGRDDRHKLAGSALLTVRLMPLVVLPEGASDLRASR
jgi:hypothetical protein